MKGIIGFIILLFLESIANAQPANDNWKNAYEIDFTSGIQGTTTFQGKKTSFKKASVERFETFPRSLKLVALNKKSVWYKFKTLSPQKITVTLRQNDTIISPQDLGLVVYDATGFYPQAQDRSYTFASLTHIGETSNSCLPQGEYYIQVCARKNVNDSVWIDIAAEPSNEPGNTIDNAVEVNHVSNENFTSNGCFSLESVEEAEPYDTAHFKRSGYLKFTTPDSLGECKFNVSGYQFAYLLYEGNPIDSSSWKLLDSFSSYKSYKTNNHDFKSSCDGLMMSNTTYFIKVLTGLTGNFRILNFTLETNKVSPGSNPKDEISNLGKFSNSGTTYFNDFINCGENGTEYLCKKLKHLLIDTIWKHPVLKPIIDTMNFGNWAEFELENHFQINYRGYDTRNSNYGLTKRKKTWLFTGSYGDSNFCNQTPVNLDTYSECASPGKYTVFTGFYRNNISYNDTIYEDFFGNRIYYDLDFYKRDSFVGKPARLYDEKYPAQYANILAGGSEIDQRKLAPDWIGGPYRELEIDGIEIKGNCAFYTFELSQDAWVYLSAKGHREYWHYVFEGDCSKGLDSLGKFVGNNVRGYLLEPTYNFDQLKKGTYTIIAFRAKSTPCNHPEFYQTNYILKATTIEDEKKDGGDWKCTPLYQFAKIAGQVNDGNALTCNEPKNSNKKTSYKVPETCLDETNNRGNVHWYNKKKYPGLRAQYAYLEFELKDKSDVFFHTNTHFQVLKGFISKDSSIAKNEKNVSVEHAYGQYRDCTFPAGKYTLVIHGTATYWFNIEVGHARKNEADHAANAKTLGLISSNNPKVSRSAAFNCNSTFSETDYIKDANTWFTFRVAGRGKVYLSGIDQNSNQYSVIAQGSRNHFLDYEQLKKLGSIDSIAGVNQNLLYANREGKQKYIYKNTTETIRYYVLARSQVPSGIFNLQVEFEFDSLATPIGDYCSNAIKGSITGNGNLQLGQWASVHTIGEGANEQFKNQLKEVHRNLSDLKTTWFSVDFKNVQGSKLFVSGNNSNAYEIKVYRGDCSAMTLVGALSSWQNISLDCIQDGTYMFQLYSNAYVHDSVVLNIQVLSANGICPMVDPQKVIANFELTNGCAGDSIQFINLSSAGTAIAYKWHFGNGDTSSKVNPSRIFKGVDDSLLVSLVVRNKTTLESDTAYEWIYLNKPILELINDTTVCGTDISLEIENFDARKYLYGWHIANRYVTIDGLEQLRTYAKGRRYTYSLWADTVNQIIVSARNKNCTTLDTVRVYSIPMILANKEQESLSSLCYKQTDTIQIKKPDFPKVDAFWNDGETQLSRIVTDTGTYNFTLKTAHCKYDGAIAVIGTKGPIYHLDSVFCQGDNISDHLNIIHPGDYQLIKINDTTKWLAWLQDSLITFNWSAHGGMCRFYDTLKAPISGYWSREGFDSTICQGDTIELKVFTNSYKLVWNNGHEGKKQQVYAPGTYILNASISNCSYSSEFNISMLQKPINITDTTVCNFDTPLFFKLRDSFDVLWSTGENAQSITVNDSGIYWFVAKTENCEFSDTFRVLRDCPPQLYIPNAFSPGNDNLNPTFIAKGTEIENYEMRIYAQNGQRVFYTDDLNEGWDGTVRFEAAPIGSYYYVITYTLNGESRVESGNLSLIR